MDLGWASVLILLPPSEGKAEPSPRRRPGRPVDLGALSFPALTLIRAQVLDAVVSLCSGPPNVAREALHLPVGLAEEVTRNRALRSAPTMPAGALYRGVLFDTLGLDSLDTLARRRANRSVVITSALWGPLRLRDRVPRYRLSAGVSLPGLGSVTAAWRTPLEKVLPDAVGRGLLLDLRSSAYAAMWRPTGAVAERTVTVRVLHERRRGDPTSRVVVSHLNKATKGRLVRALLLAGADPRTPAALEDCLHDLGFVVEPRPVRTGRPKELDVVVRQV